MWLMFVADDSALVWDGDCNLSLVVQNDTLTAETAFQSRVDGAIDKVFFFV
jgi:hypothetical protein